MLMVVFDAKAEEEMYVEVASLEAMDELLHEYSTGVKAPGGLYAIKGFFEVAAAPAMVDAVRALKVYMVHPTKKGADAVKVIISMGKLHDHLVSTMTHVNLLLAIADGDKQDLDKEIAAARAEYEEKHGKPAGIHNEFLVRKAKDARLRIMKLRAPQLKQLRAKSLKAYRRYKVGAELEKKLLAFHRRVVKMVAFVLSGKRTMEWLIRELERLNEVDLPNLIDTPTLI